MKELIAAACERPLSGAEAERAFALIMEGDATPAQMGGFLMGPPKVFNGDDFDRIRQIPHAQGTYFAEVQFYRIPHALHFPILHLHQNGAHNYTNDADQLTKTTHWMDRVFLDDVIKYHKLQPGDYRVIRGYYFDEGRNNQVREFMEFLKIKRDEAKACANPIENLYKLLANSLYGRMLMKPVKTQRVFQPMDKKLSYMQMHYHSIVSVQDITPNICLFEQTKSLIEHWALPHVGSEILSFSKHIMNVPMMLAEEHGINNYYMDTDSMHIELDKVPQLAQLFEAEVGYPLLGDGFGQFKCDFALKDAQGRPCKNVRANGSLIVGKKCYLDMLEGTDPDGNPATGFHARIKGCSAAALYEKGIELLPESSRRAQMYAIYDSLINGNEVEFNLLAKGEGAKLGFISNKNFTTVTRDKFTRKYSFPGDIKFS
jgi:hypothetical protein